METKGVGKRKALIFSFRGALWPLARKPENCGVVVGVAGQWRERALR